jgi:hypothetical protein
MKYLSAIGEQISDFSRSLFSPSWGSSAIRSFGRFFPFTFWSSNRPQSTEVNYTVTRSLYRNEGDYTYGSGFAKPIVDLQVGFIGLPLASTDDEATNEFLNDCLTNFWVEEIQQMLRDAIRDSKCIVRVQRPDILDPLMTLDEAEHCALEIIPPELVEIERNIANKRIIERAVIRHVMTFVKDEGDVASGQDPTVEEHDVLEVIDRDNFRFFDQTDDVWLTDLQRVNPWNFVPLVEVYNEWDSALNSGQSDFETVVPFMQAFHEVLKQGLQAHKYHSTPKVVMNLIDVASFIKNNFPEAVDQTTGEIMPHAEISWRGREILFLQTEDKMTFLEAKSVLGDTTALLEFLIDCICIASQTPEWAFLRVSTGTANSDRNAQTVPFVKKIDRKRRSFQKPIQELLKMVLVMSNSVPIRPRLSWEIVRADDLVVYMQAFQQLVMGLEVAVQRGEISDETYRRMIKLFLPAMKSTSQEAIDAKSNLQLPAPTPVQSQSPSQPFAQHA